MDETNAGPKQKQPQQAVSSLTKLLNESNSNVPSKNSSQTDLPTYAEQKLTSPSPGIQETSSDESGMALQINPPNTLKHASAQVVGGSSILPRQRAAPPVTSVEHGISGTSPVVVNGGFDQTNLGRDIPFGGRSYGSKDIPIRPPQAIQSPRVNRTNSVSHTSFFATGGYGSESLSSSIPYVAPGGRGNNSNSNDPTGSYKSNNGFANGGSNLSRALRSDSVSSESLDHVPNLPNGQPIQSIHFLSPQVNSMSIEPRFVISKQRDCSGAGTSSGASTGSLVVELGTPRFSAGSLILLLFKE